jgi:hypothetical protein
MFRVSLLPGEMTRDISGLRPESITLKYGSWVDISEAELKALLSDPVLAPKLSVIQTVNLVINNHITVNDQPSGVQTLPPVQVAAPVEVRLEKKKGFKKKV